MTPSIHPSKALEEAAHQLSKSRSPDRDSRMQQLSARMSDIQRFLDARATLMSDPAAAVGICQQLLAAGGADSSSASGVKGAGAQVRAGDVLAMLVEWCVAQNNAAQALQLLQQMVARGLTPERFLEGSVVQGVYQAMGVAAGGGAGTEQRQAVAAAAGGDQGTMQQQQQQQGGRQHQRDEDVVEEEVDEENLPYVGDADDDSDA